MLGASCKLTCDDALDEIDNRLAKKVSFTSTKSLGTHVPRDLGDLAIGWPTHALHILDTVWCIVKVVSCGICTK